MRRVVDAVVLSVAAANAYQLLVLATRYVASRAAMARHDLGSPDEWQERLAGLLYAPGGRPWG